jgi:hypothetical protein
MKNHLPALWSITKEVFLAPLAYALGAFVVSSGVVLLYRLASGWVSPPDWLRVGNEILVITAQLAALVSFVIKQWRVASEDYERVIESRIRIRKLRDEL